MAWHRPGTKALSEPMMVSDVMWQLKSGSTLAQVMACSMMAPSLSLNQCWLNISMVLCHSPKEDSNGNAGESNQCDLLGNYTFKIKPHPPEDTELMFKIHIVYKIKDTHYLRSICHLGVGWNQFKSFQHIFVILLWADINSKVNKQRSLVFCQLTQISCRPNNCKMYYHSGIPWFNPWVTTCMLTSALSSLNSMMST